jgi:hypothetical protein
MAATTMSAILTRFETVLEAPPINLVRAPQPFSDDQVPNALVDSSYRVMAGGIVRDEPTSNFQSMRVERVTVSVMQALKMDGYQAQRDLEDLCDVIERELIADGLAQGYLVSIEKGSKKAVRPKGTDICRAEVNLLVDYDWDASA